ncbi:FAD-binding domain-containing protein [Bimuria novae-zelandiae CBS 107.79]|uniref:FAD-binding domain-containing protein n=1 Tax=Bimuria novae-zelandiae CBS 107.79 TaxID=1447943 RepID=A0A6A5UP10_9PLEO|nr:FAD-binding domain-containing protein [Bimuria novae-zelandiae CBS 107.79]
MGSASVDIYEELKAQLKDSKTEVLLPGDGQPYEESIKRWSEHCEKRAACVVKPTSPDAITTTLHFVRKHKISFVVRGGGHSTSGSNSILDSLVIDLSLMRGVTVDADTQTIRVEGGALWVDVDEEAAKYGLAIVGGTVNHTGVGGLTLGGGYGYLTGRYGLAIDNLLKVEIVLASGEQVVASETEYADLFWAMRGAGQNFGVVTAFTFRAWPQENPVFAGPLIFLPEKLVKVVEFMNAFHEKTDGDQVMILAIACPPPARAPVALTMLFHNGTLEEGQAFFKDLIDVGPVANMTGMMPYSALNAAMNQGQDHGGRRMFGGGAYKLPLEPSSVQKLFDEFIGFSTQERKNMQDSLLIFETIPYKKVIEVPNEKMAFANRGEYYNLATMIKWYEPEDDDTVREFSRGLLKKASQAAGVVADEKVRAAEGVGVYGNYVNPDVPASEVYGSNAKKLTELKHKYDPDNLFDGDTRLVPRPIVVVN